MKSTNEIKFKTVAELVNEHIDFVLQYCSGNITDAAKILGINRRTIHRWLHENRGYEKVTAYRERAKGAQ
jgi:DNA-binding protein Fis